MSCKINKLYSERLPVFGQFRNTGHHIFGLKNLMKFVGNHVRDITETRKFITEQQ
jgi:hypothetical protein